MRKNKLYKLDYEQWLKKFKPQTNHIDQNAAFDGHMYETYGKELDYVITHLKSDESRKRIWTLIDGDGICLITEGYHIVNRLGYFITDKSFNFNNVYEINLDS
jgi:hypothetical protein